MKLCWIHCFVVSLTIVCICTAGAPKVETKPANISFDQSSPLTTPLPWFTNINQALTTKPHVNTADYRTQNNSFITSPSSSHVNTTQYSTKENVLMQAMETTRTNNITASSSTLVPKSISTDGHLNVTGTTASYYDNRTKRNDDAILKTISSSTIRLSNATRQSIGTTTPMNTSTTEPFIQSTTSQNVWEFLPDRQTFNSSTTITETSAQHSWTSSTAHLSTEMPRHQKVFFFSNGRLSAGNSTTSPWDKLASSLQNGNHFNPIVNVNVDSSSSAESLEKFRRLEAMITNRINAMEKLAENLVSTLKTRISQLEAAIGNVKCATTDTQELKNHLELLFNKHSKSLEVELMKFVQKTDDIGISNQSVKATDKVETKTTTRLPLYATAANQARLADNSMAEWRAKRTKLIERWENNFHGTAKKKSSKRSLHRDSS